VTGELIPYDELDPPIVPLVRTLNGFPGIETLGCCAGHETPLSGNSAPADEWWVTFTLEPADPSALVAIPTPEAWVSLEFLAYMREQLQHAGHELALRPYAPPPFLNLPGRMLRFELHGWRGEEPTTEPAEIADKLDRAAEEYYETWPEED